MDQDKERDTETDKKADLKKKKLATEADRQDIITQNSLPIGHWVIDSDVVI